MSRRSKKKTKKIIIKEEDLPVDKDNHITVITTDTLEVAEEILPKVEELIIETTECQQVVKIVEEKKNNNYCIIM